MTYSHITTIDEVKAFFTQMVTIVGEEWHPDDDYLSYKNPKTREPLFTPEEAQVYNGLQRECFAVCEAADVDVYDLGWEVIEKCIA